MKTNEAAIHFAFMNLNKRGGTNSSGPGEHIEEYCKYYANYINKEIEIIDSDIIIWLGVNTFDLRLPEKYLHASASGDKVILKLNGKLVSIIRMWHTSHYRCNNEPEPGYSNRIIGKHIAKLKQEMARHNL